MSPSEFRRIIRQAQRPILDIIDKGAVAGGGLAFDFGPFLVGHEGGPARLQRLGVGPFQQVDEFELSLGTRLPHGADVEAVAGHDADGMVAEAVEAGVAVFRSEERRVGKDGVSSGRYRWLAYV